MNNSTNNLGNNVLSSTMKPCLMFIFVVGGCITCLICLFGLIFNGLAAFIWATMSKSGWKPTTSNMLVMALELSDIILLVLKFLLISFPIFLEHTNKIVFRHYSKFTAYGMQIFNAFGTGGRISSNWFLVIISVDRYLAICKPTSAKSFTPKKAKIVICLVYLLSFLFALVRNFEFKPLFNEKQKRWIYAATNLKENETYGITYRIILHNILVIIAPFVIALVLTIIILKNLHTKVSSVQSVLSNNARYLTMSLMAVNMLFFICFSFEIFRLVISGLYFKKILVCGHTFMYYSIFTDCMTLINSSSNFFLFSFFNKNFKRRVKEFFKLKLITATRNQSSEDENQSIQSNRTENGKY